jgi:hypothetical protein
MKLNIEYCKGSDGTSFLYTDFSVPVYHVLSDSSGAQLLRKWCRSRSCLHATESRRTVRRPTKKIELLACEAKVIEVAGPKTPTDF